MSVLIAFLVAVGLLVLFLLLTAFETGKGVRILAPLRTRFDKQVSRFAFVARHVDFGAFIMHVIKAVGRRVAHDVAHITLIVVRAVERFLTRTVRYLRSRMQHTRIERVSENRSPFVETISYFKATLKETSKEPEPKVSEEEKIG